MAAPRIQDFGTAPCGAAVKRVQIENGGSRAAVITWGASLQDYRVTGWDGAVILGSPDLDAYLGPLRHCGAVVGRVANRIANGRARLQGKLIELERNENGVNCLHGGHTGSSQRNWTITDHDRERVVLALTLKDGDGGFPGTLKICADYKLDTEGALCLSLVARTDAPTFCNLAHHAYWSFDPDDSLRQHGLQVFARHYLPVDANLIPLGAPELTAGTRFDFGRVRPVRPAGDAVLDHTFCFAEIDGPRPMCKLRYGPMALDVQSDAPGVQIYDGAHLDSGVFPTLSGARYGAHAGLAIEPQAWPDAPNHHDYPDITLMPGETFQQVSRFHPHVCQ